MTQRLIIGIDPGLTGAVAVLADGEPAGLFDLATVTRNSGSLELNVPDLAARLRGLLQTHAGAYMLVAIEHVQPMPSTRGPAGEARRGMGAASAFNFGETVGAIRATVQALGLPMVKVTAVRWKNALGLRGTEKDAARTKAIELYPVVATQLSRKKDIGRADALLIAHWAHRTEQVAAAA